MPPGALTSPGQTPASLREAAALFVRHASARVVLIALALAVGARIALGGWSLWDLAPVAAIAAFWPLLEWLIHDFILHAKPLAIGGYTFDGRVPQKHRA